MSRYAGEPSSDRLPNARLDRNLGLNPQGGELAEEAACQQRRGDPGVGKVLREEPQPVLRPLAGGARRQGDGDGLAALAQHRQGPMPPLEPRASMYSPIASETRSPFRASSEIRACSDAGPSPAATNRATSLWSSPMAWDS